jgi:gas vesicle protein
MQKIVRFRTHHKIFGKILETKTISTLLTLKNINLMSTQKILIGAFAGLVAGAVLGILLAPASGAETRQKIADTAGDLKDKMRDFYGKVGEGINDLKSTLSRKTSEMKSDFRNRSKELVNSGIPGYQEGTNEALGF